jgi:hypothetical protein
MKSWPRCLEKMVDGHMRLAGSGNIRASRSDSEEAHLVSSPKYVYYMCSLMSAKQILV